MMSSSNNHNKTTCLSRWSPITSFPVQPLTASGLRSLDTSDGEVEICTTSLVELRSLTQMTNNTASSTTWHDRDRDLLMTLTTHRIILQTSTSSSFSASNFLHLSNIQSHTMTGGEWMSNRSYKILIETSTHGNFHFVFRGKVPKQERDYFYSHMEKALKRRQWEEASRLLSRPGVGHGIISSSTGVGVAGIVERNRLRHEHNANLANEVFGNSSLSHQSKQSKIESKKEREKEVDTLMREAKELTNIINKYVSTLEKDIKNDHNNEKGNSNYDDQELQSMLSHMGMISTTSSKHQSKSSSSMSIYYETLARQICDFLLQNKSFSIAKGGNGIMTLTDVYCLFNRARGANMVSPEDLITALEQMEKLGLKMKIREFEHGSGVTVLQETGFDDSETVKKITDYIDKQNYGRVKTGVTALEAGRILQVSPLLAKEQLLSAEQNGYLCRDITLEGTRFFCNLFSHGNLFKK